MNIPSNSVTATGGSLGTMAPQLKTAPAGVGAPVARGLAHSDITGRTSPMLEHPQLARYPYRWVDQDPYAGGRGAEPQGPVSDTLTVPVNPRAGTRSWKLIGTARPGCRLVYRLHDKHGVLLYVGMTANPATRWFSHSQTKRWWRRVATATLVEYASKREAAQVEKDAIQSELPKHNIQHRAA